jgi:fucose 4-O-acetylase-like acetyltransferase
MATNPKFRDQSLDIAKGIAIILVVIGHAIQNRYVNFDELLGFRLIYSFHMPLFIFLSGAVASLWFKPDEIALPFKEFISIIGIRIQKSAIRLLLPFISWALISNIVRQTGAPLLEVVIMAFRRPDTALWFLLCIFYCVVLFSAFQLILAGLQASNRQLRSILKIPLDGRWQLFFIAIAWLLIEPHMPPASTLDALKSYFLFYVLGMGFYKYLGQYFIARWRYTPYVIFLPLVFYWSRISPNHLLISLNEGWSKVIIATCFAPLVAISGTLLTWEMSSRLQKIGFKSLNQFIAYCGKLSLGIYALHYFFLELNPPALIPLALSILISMILLRFRLTKLFLLGER